MDQKATFRLEEPILQDSPLHKASLMKSRPAPRRKRFQSIIKSLIGRGKQTQEQQFPADTSDENSPIVDRTDVSEDQRERIENQCNTRHAHRADRTTPDRNGSSTHLCDDKPISHSTLSLNTVQQKLINVVPLLKRQNSRGSSSLHQHGKSHSVVRYTSMRKCETVLALSRQLSTYSHIPENAEIDNYSNPNAYGGGTFYKRSISLNVPELKHYNSSVEPLRPLNRLRSTVSVKGGPNCSCCSSIMLGSQTSQHKALGGERGYSTCELRVGSIGDDGDFCSVYESSNRVSYVENQEAYDFHRKRQRPNTIQIRQSYCETDEIDGPNEKGVQKMEEIMSCKLCLIDVKVSSEATKLHHCGCMFCTECMQNYIEFEIKEGAYDISCPDAQCPAEGVVSLSEIAILMPAELVDKHHRYRFNREVELDKTRTWCPRAGCETVCTIINPQSMSTAIVAAATGAATTSSAVHSNGKPGKTKGTNAAASTSIAMDSKSNSIIPASTPYAVQCPTCKEKFCPDCKKPWHQNLTCDDYRKRLVEEGLLEEISDFPYESDAIKFCPMCGVPIEKDSGCAQMMCKRCKHVFCWYCLASLDDDFLLRHYDAGPCKNKLGHSRASVIWHRAQVIGIFAGFGMLLVIASPLLLLAVPCILCCKCQPCCSDPPKTEDVDVAADFDEVPLER